MYTQAMDTLREEGGQPALRLHPLRRLPAAAAGKPPALRGDGRREDLAQACLGPDHNHPADGVGARRGWMQGGGRRQG